MTLEFLPSLLTPQAMILPALLCEVTSSVPKGLKLLCPFFIHVPRPAHLSQPGSGGNNPGSEGVAIQRVSASADHITG